MDVKIFGRRKKLFNKLSEIKKKHEDDAEEIRKLTEEVDRAGVLDLIRGNTLSL